ncbi:MAG TPA: phosphate/phosphite/phosphonate ABC transporter substrate-binding protein [Parasulfuritortus sp.]
MVFFDRVSRLLGVWKHAAAVTAIVLAPAVQALAAAGPVYTLGVVPQFEQRKLFAIWKPVVDELERRSGLNIRLVVTLTIPEFETALEKGTFDFVYTNPFEILRAADRQGYIPLVRDAHPLYGILVVRRDSPLNNVDQLQGKTLAVPSPNALGASLLLRADLERLHGIHMVMVNAKTHSSVYLHVLNGLTDAGGGVQKTLAEQPAGIRDGLRVLYTTRAMPSHPIAAHPRVPPEIRKRLQKALLEMAVTPSGKALLDKIPMPAPVPATLADYRLMKDWKLDTYWVEGGE